jgi:hypothetical protein
MSDNVKSIQITGGAELAGSRRRRLSKKRDKGLPVGPTVSKQNQEGGADCGPLGPFAPNKVQMEPLSQAFRPLTQPGTDPQQLTKLAVSAMPGPMHGGRKVELRKTQPSKKVQLHSKKAVLPSKPGLKHGTKKNRKIVLGLVSLERRQTRAKKISQKMKEMPIDRLRKQLIEQGLIKPSSKAPESILRQIAADSQIVGGNGL